MAAEGVDHVSAYVLTIEDGTPFARDRVRVDGDAEDAALDAAESVLGDAGLRRYEVSNHARPGHECRHNLAYWDNRCWLGLGPERTATNPRRPVTRSRFVAPSPGSRSGSTAMSPTSTRGPRRGS